jgi:hypothetical protein
MSTQTLKACPGGADEQQRPSVELPAPLHPAKNRLAKVLADYEKLAQDLEDARGHLSRSEVDEAAALDSQESDAEDRIAVAQRSRGIYGARVANREAGLKKLALELKAAAQVGQQEFHLLVMAELGRRSEILLGRIMEAGQLLKDRTYSADVERLLGSSKPMLDIHSLDIPSSMGMGDDGNLVAGMARRVLEGYEALAVKKKEQI